jgi:hypothetical protein
MRRLALLASCFLAAAASATEGASVPEPAPSPASQEPACLQARAGLPGTITRTSISGHPIRGKRLVIHRQGVTLVLDHAVFAATTRAFLDRYGPGGFPEETELLRRFSEELAHADEIDADRIVGDGRLLQRFEYRLAEILERGGFEVRAAAGKPEANRILRLEYTHHCGGLCGSGGRVFVTDTCQPIVRVLDWIS